VNGSSSEVKSLTVNTQTAAVNPDGSFSTAISLADGANTIITVATDQADYQAIDTRTVTLDQTAPTLTVTTPADNSKTNRWFAVLSGTVDKDSTVTHRVNGGTPQAAAMTGMSFNSTINLSSGLNTIEITATDLAGNTSSQKRTAIYDPDKPTLAITDPAQDLTTSVNSITIKGTVTDALTTITLSVAVDDHTFTPPLADGTFALPVTFNREKTYPVIVTATDETGNSAVVQRNVIYAIPVSANLADTLKALQIATGAVRPTAAELARADVAPIIDGVPQPDGKVDIKDVIVMLRRVVGLPL
jgi:large repetitive protein